MDTEKSAAEEIEAMADEIESQEQEQAELITAEETAEENKRAEAESIVTAAFVSAGFDYGLRLFFGAGVPSELQEELIVNMAAVIAKHDGELPPWLLKYKEELLLGKTLALVFLGVVVQVRENKEKEVKEAEETEKETGKNNGEE